MIQFYREIRKHLDSISLMLRNKSIKKVYVVKWKIIVDFLQNLVNLKNFY